jgi:DNA-binding MarR family transcriptional regulator
VLGPLAKRAMRIHAGGDKRRKLLVLICAYADAGEPSPAVATLAARLKLPNQAIDPLLDHLQQDGFLTVARREHHRNVYTVHFNGGSS